MFITKKAHKAEVSEIRNELKESIARFNDLATVLGYERKSEAVLIERYEATDFWPYMMRRVEKAQIVHKWMKKEEVPKKNK